MQIVGIADHNLGNLESSLGHEYLLTDSNHLISVGQHSFYFGWGCGSTPQEARARALAGCRQRTTGCYVAVTVYSEG